MFVLDTNIVSELRKVRSGKADPGVAAWAEQVPSAELFISTITLHELEHGVLLMERSDPAQGALLRTWLDQRIAAAFKSRVLAVDERVVRRAAAQHAHHRRSRRPSAYRVGARCSVVAAEQGERPPSWPVGAGNSVVGVDQR